MRGSTRSLTVALLVLALAVIPATVAACGSSGGQNAGQGEWQEVLSTKISGKEPVKLNLGTHQVGTKVRLAWDLTGPESPPVILTFRLINADYGTGFGYSARPTDKGFQTKTDNAMTIGPIKSGNFTIYFSQRYKPGEGPGYDGTITVYTLK